MDERLLIEAAQKDSSRFAELYEANFDRVMTYCDRMPKEWAVYCIKDATARDEGLCNTPAFIKFAADNSDIMG